MLNEAKWGMWNSGRKSVGKANLARLWDFDSTTIVNPEWGKNNIFSKKISIEVFLKTMLFNIYMNCQQPKKTHTFLNQYISNM